MQMVTKLTLLAATIVIFGCGQRAELPEKPAPKVKVVELDSRSTEERLYLPAIAHSADRSHLSFRVSGEVNQIMAKEGDRIKAGDVLAMLDPTDYQLDVDNAQANFTVLDNQFKRSRPLVKKGLLAKSQFDEIAAQREIASAELELAKLRLSFTTLKAPVDGIISRVHIDQFENVKVGQEVINIHSIEEVEIFVQLPDQLYVNSPPSKQDLAKMQLMVRVRSGNEYPATIKEYTTEPDPNFGTYIVTLTLPMPKQEYILDGMAVEVSSTNEEIELEAASIINVPIEAIFNGDGDSLSSDETYVWVVSADNKVVKTTVRLGKAFKNSIQILNGLNVGEKVVVAGVAKLRNGMEVDVIDQEAM